MTRQSRAGVRVGAYGAGRTQQLHIRVSPEEHAAYTAHAARWGLSVGQWARETLDAQLPPAQGVPDVQQPSDPAADQHQRDER